GEIHGEPADAGRQLPRGLLEKSASIARRPAWPKALEPLGLDVERENDGARPTLVVNIGVGLPGIDQHRLRVGQRDDPAADRELGVGAFGFDQHMAVRVRVAYEGAVHVEQSDTPKPAVSNPQSRRHGSDLGDARHPIDESSLFSTEKVSNATL